MKNLFLIILITATLGGGYYFYSSQKKENLPKFKTQKITKGDIESNVSATGTINAVTTILVGTQVSGTIKDLFADFNTIVKKDQVIAEIEPSSFEAQVEQAMANLLSSEANLEKAEVMALQAKRLLDRNNKLYNENLISKKDIDSLSTDYESAKAQIKVAKAQIAQAKASLKIAEVNLKNTKILSPVDGIVISRNVNIGQTVAASFQTPTLFTIAQDLTKMQIDTNVDEADIGKIKVDQNVVFSVDSYPDIIFKGKVSQIRMSPTTVQNVVTYDVVVLVENTDLKLKPGMTANVDINIASRKNVLRVPNAALRFKPDEKELEQINSKMNLKNAKNQKKASGLSIWILENNKIREIEIKIGITDKSFTEVLSVDALREGQDIILESMRDKKEKGPNLRFF